jgi:hypothetical protein
MVAIGTLRRRFLTSFNPFAGQQVSTARSKIVELTAAIISAFLIQSNDVRVRNF